METNHKTVLLDFKDCLVEIFLPLQQKLTVGMVSTADEERLISFVWQRLLFRGVALEEEFFQDTGDWVSFPSRRSRCSFYKTVARELVSKLSRDERAA